MKITRLHSVFTRAAWLALALAGGCTTSSDTSTVPKPGRGIADYRQVVREAHRAVSATVQSLDGLVLPPTMTPVPPTALSQFDKSFSRLEVTSVKARARAEAIIARGEAYFEEGKSNLGAATNQAGAKVETERQAKLLAHFNRIRDSSAGVREEFRPFMSALREFRATLDPNLAAISAPPAQGRLAGLTAHGRRVLEKLDTVSAALNDAEAEVQAAPATK